MITPQKKSFRKSKHCPRCGGRLALQTEHPTEPKRLTCSTCSYRVYDNPIVASEAFIIRDGKLLLLRRAQLPNIGTWDIPGGFIEAGERPEDGIAREFREELKVRLVKPKLFGAYESTYNFQNEITPMVVLAFQGDIRGRLQLNHENSEARWFPLGHALRLAFQHQRHALRDLKKLLKQKQ